MSKKGPLIVRSKRPESAEGTPAEGGLPPVGTARAESRGSQKEEKKGAPPPHTPRWGSEGGSRDYRRRWGASGGSGIALTPASGRGRENEM